jgi:3-dehydroquinate synthetase
VTESSVLVAELVSGHEWTLHTGDGNCYTVAGPEGGAPHLELVAFAERLTNSQGGPMVRSVVLVTDKVDGREALVLARYPRNVHVMSHTLALAHAAPPLWSKFFVADFIRTQAVSLVLRVNGTLAEERIENCTLSRLSDLAASMSVVHGVVRTGKAAENSGTGQLLWRLHASKVVTAVSEEPAAGARRYAEGLHRGDGVWQPAPGVARLKATRSISYDIHRPPQPVFHVEDDTLALAAEDRPVFFVLDERVADLYGAQIRAYAKRRLNTTGEIVIVASESNKTLSQVDLICRTATQAGLSRRGFIIAAGGGITLDIAGLAASMLRRGVGYIRIPTTLVGLVDVSVGVKQAVNAFGEKNILGSFYPPHCSINDYRFLQSLPVPALAAGVAEIVKIALVRDERLLSDLECHTPLLMRSHWQAPPQVAQSIAVRAELLMMEELSTNLFETGLARLVDFGHSFSPLIETSSQYRISHGEAVALDIFLSTAIGVRRNLCDASLLTRVGTLLQSWGLSVCHPAMPPAAAIYAALDKVRLHRGGDLNLVIPTAAGSAVFLQDVSKEEIGYASDMSWEFSKGGSSPPLAKVMYESAGV